MGLKIKLKGNLIDDFATLAKKLDGLKEPNVKVSDLKDMDFVGGPLTDYLASAMGAAVQNEMDEMIINLLKNQKEPLSNPTNTGGLMLPAYGAYPPAQDQDWGLIYSPEEGYLPRVLECDSLFNHSTMSFKISVVFSSGIEVVGSVSKEFLEGLGGVPFPDPLFYNPKLLPILVQELCKAGSARARFVPPAYDVKQFGDYALLLGGPSNGMIEKMQFSVLNTVADVGLSPLLAATQSEVPAPEKMYTHTYPKQWLATKLPSGKAYKAAVGVSPTVPDEAIMSLFKAALEEFPLARLLPQYAPFWLWLSLDLN